jgi:hypothetical protein
MVSINARGLFTWLSTVDLRLRHPVIQIPCPLTAPFLFVVESCHRFTDIIIDDVSIVCPFGPPDQTGTAALGFYYVVPHSHPGLAARDCEKKIKNASHSVPQGKTTLSKGLTTNLRIDQLSPYRECGSQHLGTIGHRSSKVSYCSSRKWLE